MPSLQYSHSYHTARATMEWFGSMQCKIEHYIGFDLIPTERRLMLSDPSNLTKLNLFSQEAWGKPLFWFAKLLETWSCNCSERWFYKASIQGFWIWMHTNNGLLYGFLSQKIPVLYFEVCGYNVAISKKKQTKNTKYECFCMVLLEFFHLFFYFNL